MLWWSLWPPVFQGVPGSAAAEGRGPLPQSGGAVAHGRQVQVAGRGCACGEEHPGSGLPGGSRGRLGCRGRMHWNPSLSACGGPKAPGYMCPQALPCSLTGADLREGMCVVRRHQTWGTLPAAGVLRGPKSGRMASWWTCLSVAATHCNHRPDVPEHRT